MGRLRCGCGGPDDAAVAHGQGGLGARPDGGGARPDRRRRPTSCGPRTEGRRVEKVRHRVPLPTGDVVEVDVYGARSTGSSPSRSSSRTRTRRTAFAAPDWCGRELTGEAAWSNASSPCRDGPRRLTIVIEAAGGVVWRRGSKGSLKVLLVHRASLRRLVVPEGQARRRRDPPRTPRCARWRRRRACAARPATSSPEVRYDDRKGAPSASGTGAWSPSTARSSRTTRSTRCAGCPSPTPSDALSYAHDLRVLDGLRQLQLERVAGCE